MKNNKKKKRCWAGYKPTPGKKPYSPGSCMKEAVDAQALADAYLDMATVIAEAGLGHKIGKAKHSARIKTGHAMMKAGGKVSPEKGSKPSALSKVRKRLGAALQNTGSKQLQRAERDADIYEMRDLPPEQQRSKVERARLAAFKQARQGKGRRTPQEINRSANKRENEINRRQRKKEREQMDEGRKGTMPKKFSVKSGDKSASGGLTAKGVARYRAKNPGSKLKTAVTTKPSKLKKGSKAANRRKSFCSRMGGLKKRLTSSKTANDPNSRVNKALRKWNC